jgi:hypothetical protein
VRIRISEAANKPVAEVLAQVKPIIPGAYVVRQLRSGDIEGRFAGCFAQGSLYVLGCSGPLQTGILSLL